MLKTKPQSKKMLPKQSMSTKLPSLQACNLKRLKQQKQEISLNQISIIIKPSQLQNKKHLRKFRKKEKEPNWKSKQLKNGYKRREKRWRDWEKANRRLIKSLMMIRRSLNRLRMKKKNPSREGRMPRRNWMRKRKIFRRRQASTKKQKKRYNRLMTWWNPVMENSREKKRNLTQQNKHNTMRIQTWNQPTTRILKLSKLSNFLRATPNRRRKLLILNSKAKKMISRDSQTTSPMNHP